VAGDAWSIGTVQEAFKLFEKGILKGKCTDLTFLEGRHLFSVCCLLGGVRGVWDVKRPKFSRFHSAVTVSDWAYGFMLLEAHRAAWLQEVTSGKTKDTKRTRQEQQKSMENYHAWFSKISKAQNGPDGAKEGVLGNIDDWLLSLAKEFSKAKVAETKKEDADDKVKKEEETYDDETFKSLKETNPFLLGITFESI
jgi:hypothetical protein